MNLVVDDAVEVRLATKTEEEKRRQLGTDFTACLMCYKLAYVKSRSDSA